MDVRPDLQRLGAVVRERRRALGLTQRQLGERIDWVQERVSLLERGGYGLPSVIILTRLARALEYPLSALIAALDLGDIPSGGVEEAIAESAHRAALLYTMERFLAIETVPLGEVMAQASDVAAQVMGADVVELFLLDAFSRELVGVGSSTTQMAVRQRALGLDHVPLSVRSRIVEVFETGQPYANGRVDGDPVVLQDLREKLGVQSLLMTAITVEGRPIGVLVAESTHPDRFTADERHFFQAVTNWVGLVAHRAELLGR